MTKIMVDLKSTSNIDKFKADAFILNIEKYSTFNDRCFNVDEIIDCAKTIKEKGKIVIVNIDRVVEENEIDEFIGILNRLNTQDIDYYIFSDLAVLNYFSEKSLNHKLIYDAKTMIASSNDAMFYKNLGVMVMAANELNVDQIKNISNIGNACFEVYGYHQMFYSRRYLLSNFNEFNQSNYEIRNHLLNIKEEMREERYPIYESDNGTFVYTDYIYCAFEDIAEFVNNFNFIKINSMFIEEDKIIKVVDVYFNFINGKYNNIDEVYQKLLDVDNNISNGYLKNRSFLLKEGF